MFHRSRQWVKDRIPSFICRESNWWVSRWIQTHVFLCPECRKEYQSMKAVWDMLDDWKIEEPDEECGQAFIENFRHRFPGAYEPKEEVSTRSLGDWLPRIAYATAVLALGVAVFLVREPALQTPILQVAKKAKPADALAAPSAKESSDVETETQTDPLPEKLASDLPSAEEEAYLFEPVFVGPSPSLAGAPVLRGAGHFIPTTFGFYPIDSPDTTPLSRGRHTVEINNIPVTGYADYGSLMEKPY